MNPISGILSGIENVLQDVEKVAQEASQFGNLLNSVEGGLGATQGSGQNGSGIMQDVMQALPLLAAL